MVSAHSSSAPVAWRLLLLVALALTSSQSARAAKSNGGGMTMLEVEMAEKGTFSYASVSESDMEVLFEQFIFKYSRKVR